MSTCCFVTLQIPVELILILESINTLALEIIALKYNKLLSYYVEQAKKRTNDPNIIAQLDDLLEANPYGGFSNQGSENTGTLSNVKETNAKDMAYKYTHIVGFNKLSPDAFQALMSVEGFSYIYQLNNRKELEIELVEERFTETLQNLAKSHGFTIPNTVIRNGFKRTIIYTPNSGSQAMSPHYDMTAFTIIIQHGADALQVLIDDKWVDVHLEKGQALIQVGFIAYLMSNGRLMPMYHRVKAISQSRTSSVYFTSIPDDTEIIIPPEIINGELTDAVFMDIVREKGDKIEGKEGYIKVTIGALNEGVRKRLQG